MKNLYKFLLIVLVIFFMAGCHETTSPDVCDPQSGRFIKGFHYVSGDFFDENGNWDYRQWAKYYQKKRGNIPDYSCIPVERTLTLQEKIEEEEEMLYAK